MMLRDSQLRVMAHALLCAVPKTQFHSSRCFAYLLADVWYPEMAPGVNPLKLCPRPEAKSVFYQCSEINCFETTEMRRSSLL